jgi:hypothetical protein
MYLIFLRHRESLIARPRRVSHVPYSSIFEKIWKRFKAHKWKIWIGPVNGITIGLIIDAHVGGENVASVCSARAQTRLRCEITVTIQHEM